MNLMKVIETSSDVADREVFKKLSLVFGLLADQENCKEGKVASNHICHY